jgi:hypothetical protein
MRLNTSTYQMYVAINYLSSITLLSRPLYAFRKLPFHSTVNI